MKQRRIEKVLNSLDILILAFKATGGYKYREQLKATDKEIQEVVVKGRYDLKKLIVSLFIAEEMLQERGYWDRTPRWQEYQERREEAMKNIKEASNARSL